jgi:hypothetical protein
VTQEIVTYTTAEIEKVKDLEKRIVDFLPGSKDVPHDVRMAIAQISIAHGLDPWLKEVWPIPVKKNGQIVGWELMIGISGWRNAAHRTNEYWGRRFEKVSDEDRAAMGAGPKDLVTRCIVMRRKTGQQPAEFDGYGMASPAEFSKMNKFQLARLRAERDAMKAAFPISAPMGVTLTAVDDEGQAINGDHGQQWEVIEKETLTGDALQEQFARNKSALGRDDGDLTSGYNPVFEPIDITATADEVKEEIDPALCQLHGGLVMTQAASGLYYHVLPNGDYCNGITVKPPKKAPA